MWAVTAWIPPKEMCVKLTNRELDLIENIGEIQKGKIVELVLLVVLLAVYWALRYFGVLENVEIPIDTLLVIYLVIRWSGVFTNVRTEDRYVELLSRYVNNDADTIAALAERK